MNLGTDCVPTGNGYVFQIDIVALYYRLEQHEGLRSLPEGHRAISATCAAYTFINNDYNAITEVSYSNFFNALASQEFKSAAQHYAEEECSPVIVDPVTFQGVNNDGNRSTFNMSGILLVFGIMMMKRKQTRRLLGRKYPPRELVSFLARSGGSKYDVIRAASVLAGETVQVPDPVSLLARISTSSFVLRQWLVCTYQEDVTPAVDKNELRQTACMIPDRLGQGKDCYIEYSLVSLPKARLGRKDDPERVRELLSENRYGQLFSKEQLSERSKPWLFSPLDEAQKALQHGGIYPTVEVTAEMLLPSFQADTVDSLATLTTRYKQQITSATGDHDREFAIRCLQSVYEQSICARTVFNPQGLGSPLLTSNTVSKVSTGGHKWPEKQAWPEGCNDLKDRKILEIFEMIGGPEHDRVVATLNALCEHVFSNSSSSVVDNVEVEVASARAGDAGALIVLDSDSEDESDRDAEDERADDYDPDSDIEDEDDEVPFNAGSQLEQELSDAGD